MESLTVVIILLVAVVQSLSRVGPFATPWTIAHQAPLSMGFPRQEYWSGFPFPSPGDLPNPGIELHWQADSLLFRVRWLQVKFGFHSLD